MNLDDPQELLKAAKQESRWWYYDRASRRDLEDPAWRSSWWPWFGDDEYGRKTIVLPIPFHGEVVCAFWIWTNDEAKEIRVQTYREKEEERFRIHAYAKTYVWVKQLLYIDIKHGMDDTDIEWSMYREGDPRERIDCAFLSLGCNAIRLYPQDLDDTATVTVRVERREDQQ